MKKYKKQPIAPTYIVPSRENILKTLRQNVSPLSFEQIALHLSVRVDEQEGLLKRINAMHRDGQISFDAKNNISEVSNEQFIIGTVLGHRDGFGFVRRVDLKPDLFLSQSEMFKVMHGDKVRVRSGGTDRKGRQEGFILEIIEHGNSEIVGQLINDNEWFVIPSDLRIQHHVRIKNNALNQAKEQQIVIVQLTQYPGRFNLAEGQITEILGDVNDAGMEINIAVRKFHIPHEFKSETLQKAEKLSNQVRAIDLKNRIDLRDIPFVTIDGDDAKDFDDAVYCTHLADRQKGFRLLVAIADVSHYVRPGDALDQEALERSTSVYFPRQVIPMLPEKLSNGLCSLNPQVDRCVLVCDAVISIEGVVKAYQFYPAVILSAARLTYNEVAEIINDNQSQAAQQYHFLLKDLFALYELYKVLNLSREKRGAINFETTETAIIYDHLGKIKEIIPRARNVAHRLIEECMLTANVCAADFIIQHNHLGLYRIHDGPSSDKLETLRQFLKNLNLKLEGGAKPQAQDYAQLLKQTKTRPDASILQTMLLRSFQQAVYSADNIGHFGLAYDAYTHFTSPIRRYPDLLTHRVIRAILLGKQYLLKPSSVNQLIEKTLPKIDKLSDENSRLSRAKKDKQSLLWDELGKVCSTNERRADEASRDVESWLKCYFMHDKIGEEFKGTISSVTSFGIFVLLENLFIEGLVHVSELGDDYYIFDEVRNELRSEHGSISFSLHDKVNVQLVKVNLDARKIDLRLIQPVKKINSVQILKHSTTNKITAKNNKKEKIKISPKQLVHSNKNQSKSKKNSKQKPSVSKKTEKNNKQTLSKKQKTK